MSSFQQCQHLLQVSAPEEEGMQPGSADGAGQHSTASAGQWRSSLHVQVCLILGLYTCMTQSHQAADHLFNSVIAATTFNLSRKWHPYLLLGHITAMCPCTLSKAIRL